MTSEHVLAFDWIAGLCQVNLIQKRPSEEFINLLKFAVKDTFNVYFQPRLIFIVIQTSKETSLERKIVFAI